MGRVHIEIQRVQTWLFSVPRLRAMVGANTLLGETLRVALLELARASGKGWSLDKATLWSKDGTFLTQPLVQDVLRELGEQKPADLWVDLVSEVRFRLLAAGPP